MFFLRPMHLTFVHSLLDGLVDGPFVDPGSGADIVPEPLAIVILNVGIEYEVDERVNQLGNRRILQNCLNLRGAKF